MNRSIISAALFAAISLPLVSAASSHREAPFITTLPKVDGTDVYLFRSYERGRADYVTLIANYIPFQDAPGGPNFYRLDPHAAYQINVDNNGDAAPDLSFTFSFAEQSKNLAVVSAGKSIAVPQLNIGPVDANAENLNVEESYTVALTRSTADGRASGRLTRQDTGEERFTKPVDNIGRKSIPNYAAYANQFIYSVRIPGCATSGRVFVGQRKEGFVINVGEIFDLVNTNPVGPRDAEPNDLSSKNITSLALEVPTACLTKGKEPVIGAWTTASVQRNQAYNVRPGGSTPVVTSSGGWVQVSRLANPLVNEVIVGLPDKDRFNGSLPSADVQFLKYVTNPSLPIVLNSLFGNAAKIPETPRNDLVAAFLTGVKGINQPANVRPAELMRLNTAVAITPPERQNDLGVLGGDSAGFPNGRRPVDDVADIELRVAEGALCGVAGDCGTQKSDPNHGAPYTDGTRAAGPDSSNLDVRGAVRARDTYLTVFPYLNTPLQGSPNGVAD